MSSPITTHVLDTNLGQPAAGMDVTLERQDGENWLPVAEGVTNADGRILDWLAGEERQAGIYRISFDSDNYFKRQGKVCFYPRVCFEFRLDHPEQHYHVPLLISAHGISTYRGS